MLCHGQCHAVMQGNSIYLGIELSVRGVSDIQIVPPKNWSIGFLPYMVFPVPFEHFRAYVDIAGGSYTKINSC